MKSSTIKSLLTALVLAAAPSLAHADEGEAVFTYDGGSGTYYSFGTSKKENYDLALMLTGSALKGKTIKAVQVPLDSIPNITNIKVWLSKKLTIVDKKNVADILTVDVPALTDSTISVTFDQPYTIDADTVYVGFSFNIDKLDKTNKQPVKVTADYADGGLFIHSSRTYRSWVDYSATATLATRVTLGGVEPDAAVFRPIELMHGQYDKASDVTVTLTNAGSTAISSIDYTYTQGSQSGTGHVDLAQPVQAVYGAAANVTVTLPATRAKGDYPVKLAISKVNGKANPEADKTVESTIEVYTKLPKHRAVLEEYTGTWCGFCPRGLVALEVLSQRYPDDFIGISYHNGDPMEIMEKGDFPNSVSGYPYAVLDRSLGVDPYYGSGNTSMAIEDDWKASMAEYALADIETNAYLNDDRSTVEMTTTVTFPKNYDKADNYKVEFILVSDSLYGDTWLQSNYFTGGAYGGADYYPEPEFEQFYKGASYVKGLYYPDVIIATSRLSGENATLPAAVKADEGNAFTYSFDLSKAVSTDKESLVQKYNALRVVALLLDDSGKIVNGAKSKVYANAAAGISNAKAETAAEATVYFDLAGRRLAQPAKGLNIIKMANGKTVKVMR